MNQKFKNRITISCKVRTSDAANGEIEAWSDIGEFWGNLVFKHEMSIKSAEFSKCYNVFGVSMRYNPNIKKGMRIKCGKKVGYISRFTCINKHSMSFEAMKKI